MEEAVRHNQVRVLRHWAVASRWVDIVRYLYRNHLCEWKVASSVRGPKARFYGDISGLLDGN